MTVLTSLRPRTRRRSGADAWRRTLAAPALVEASRPLARELVTRAGLGAWSLLARPG